MRRTDKSKISIMLTLTLILVLQEVSSQDLYFDNSYEFAGIDITSSRNLSIKGIIRTSSFSVNTWEYQVRRIFFKAVLCDSTGIWADCKIYRSRKWGNSNGGSLNYTRTFDITFDIFRPRKFQSPNFEVLGKKFNLTFRKNGFTDLSITSGFKIPGQIQSDDLSFKRIPGYSSTFLFVIWSYIGFILILVIFIQFFRAKDGDMKVFPLVSLILCLNLTIMIIFTQLRLGAINGSYDSMYLYWSLVLGILIQVFLVFKKKDQINYWTIIIPSIVCLLTLVLMLTLPQFGPYLIPLFMCGMIYELYSLKVSKKMSLLLLLCFITQSGLIFICYYQRPHPIGFDVRLVQGIVPVLGTLLTLIGYIVVSCMVKSTSPATNDENVRSNSKIGENLH